ncbi:MAG: ATP-binding cassette domain-containing protein [Desulfobacterales bacterium]|nr:ATP-binding cassette domain-containing protein [Desulfobacterales bacterium]
MTVNENKNAIIRLFHVHRRYGKKRALQDVTLDVLKNEFIFISGPSGAGKSTLLKLLYLGERVNEGHVLVDGLNLSRIKKKCIPDLRRKFGIIFQDYKLISTKTVYENISLVLEAIAVAGDPKIILADEPTGNLDNESASIIMDLLIRFHTRGATVIVATHDMELIRKKGGRVVILKDGHIQNISFQESPRKSWK